MDIHLDMIFHQRYRMVRELGRGAFGDVWLAQDMDLDMMEVAIKVYVALDTKGLDEFKSEYKTAYQLNHPNLLHAYHFAICDNHPYLVMPYCSRGSAEQLIEHADEQTMWRFLRDVSAGLAYLHAQNPPVVHQDIKPENILMDESGTFFITDFGISKRIRSTLRKNSARAASAGTTAYMGPERFAARPVTVMASDIWSLGVTAYEMLSGEPPFCGMGGGMLNCGAEMPEYCNRDYSAELNGVVIACLAKDTWDRPTAQALHDYADAILRGKHPDAAWNVGKETPKPKEENVTEQPRVQQEAEGKQYYTSYTAPMDGTSSVHAGSEKEHGVEPWKILVAIVACGIVAVLLVVAIGLGDILSHRDYNYRDYDYYDEDSAAVADSALYDTIPADTAYGSWK